MKKILFLCLLVAIGCTSDDGFPDKTHTLNDELQNIDKALRAGLEVCGKNTMPWLSDLLKKAEEDRLTKKHFGQYMGRISVVEYKRETFFYVTFGMGSGGIYAYLFDCEGNQKQSLLGEAPEFFNDSALKRNAMIYSTINF